MQLSDEHLFLILENEPLLTRIGTLLAPQTAAALLKLEQDCGVETNRDTSHPGARPTPGGISGKLDETSTPVTYERFDILRTAYKELTDTYLKIMLYNLMTDLGLNRSAARDGFHLPR